MKLSVIKLIFFFLLGLDFFISKAQCNRFPYPYSITIPDCNTNSYSLKFEDNFNGNSLDLNKWMLPQFGLGTKAGAGSQQLYTFDSDNVEVSNGTLKIKVQNQPKMGRVIGYCPPQCVPCATEQDIDNCILSDGLPNLRVFSYSSSSLWSIKNDFLDGKYEIRCRISKGRGLWPAFWTFSGDSNPGGTIWSEHDLFEIYYDQKMSITEDPLGAYRNNLSIQITFNLI